MYKCGNCQAVFNLSPNEGVRCPSCGGKILYKTRGTLAKNVSSI